MTTNRLCIIGLIVLVLGLLLAGTVGAQAKLTATPTQLTIAGTRGDVETRTLLLRASEPITNLQIIPLDLTRTDGMAVLPSTAIQPNQPTDQLAANSVLTVSLRFDLGGASSGEYSGDLLINYHGGALTVPITVKVRHPWPLPLLVLVVGVGLSIGVSLYRARGRPRDEVLVRVGQLRAQIRTDADLAEPTRTDQPDLAKPFRSRIKTHLLDVETALQAEKWPDAQVAADRAQTVWDHWRKGRDYWLEQLRYHARITERLEELTSDALYGQTVRRGIESAAREAPDLKNPDKLREQLDTLVQHINRYVQLRAQIDELNQRGQQLSRDQTESWRLKAQRFGQRLDALSPIDQDAYQSLQREVAASIAYVQLQARLRQLDRLCRRLPDDQAKSWQNRVQELQGQLNILSPDDQASYRNLQDKLTQAINELSQEVPRRGEPESYAKGARGIATEVAHLLSPAPPVRSPSLEAQATGARTRLQWFTWFSYAIAVTILAGAGFGTLYATNATFGANAWADYFALLAWGFGAEASRSAVTEMLRGWELPGLK